MKHYFGERVEVTAQIMKHRGDPKPTGNHNEYRIDTDQRVVLLPHPVIGIVIGKRALPVGHTRYSPNPDEPGGFYHDSSINVWLVAYRMNRTPLYVPNGHIRSLDHQPATTQKAD